MKSADSYLQPHSSVQKAYARVLYCSAMMLCRGACTRLDMIRDELALAEHTPRTRGTGPAHSPATLLRVGAYCVGTGRILPLALAVLDPHSPATLLRVGAYCVGTGRNLPLALAVLDRLAPEHVVQLHRL
eukprot:3338612-Rhodomonas_salina.2